MTTIAPAIPTAAQLVATALGLPTDDRIRVEITRTSGWDNAWCEESPAAPASVCVTWNTWDYDEARYIETDRTLAAEIAGDYITALAASANTDGSEYITVEVAHQWIRYTRPEIAGLL